MKILLKFKTFTICPFFHVYLRVDSDEFASIVMYMASVPNSSTQYVWFILNDQWVQYLGVYWYDAIFMQFEAFSIPILITQILQYIFRLYAPLFICASNAYTFFGASAYDENSVEYFCYPFDDGNGFCWWLHDSYRRNSTVFVVEWIILATTLATPRYCCWRI